MSHTDWLELAKLHPESTLVWLPADDIAGMEQLDQGATTPSKLIFSSTLLQEEFDKIPENLRAKSLVAYPFRLPEDMQPRVRFVTKWLEVRKEPATSMTIQSNAYFLNWMMTGVLRMMGDDFYRDYFLDVIDMMNDETYAIVNYPRLSFGPAQRYASKGCFLVSVDAGENPEVQAQSPWVIH